MGLHTQILWTTLSLIVNIIGRATQQHLFMASTHLAFKIHSRHMCAQKNYLLGHKISYQIRRSLRHPSSEFKFILCQTTKTNHLRHVNLICSNWPILNNINSTLSCLVHCLTIQIYENWVSSPQAPCDNFPLSVDFLLRPADMIHISMLIMLPWGSQGNSAPLSYDQSVSIFNLSWANVCAQAIEFQYRQLSNLTGDSYGTDCTIQDLLTQPSKAMWSNTFNWLTTMEILHAKK